MDPQNKEKAFFSFRQAAKLLWLIQFLAIFYFGIPLIGLVLFAANIASSVILKIILFYLAISFFIYVPIYGVLSFIFFKPVQKILDKNYKKNEALMKEELRVIERFLNSPLYLSVIIFLLSFWGFIFGLFILQLGLIPELMSLIEIVTPLGLALGFILCIVQSSLIYVFLENYHRPQIEFFNHFYPDITKTIKIIKFPIFWKVFLLAFSSTFFSLMSLSTLYLGRVMIYSPKDIKDTLIYVSIVAVLTIFYLVIIVVSASKNLVYPLKKLIIWANKIIKGRAKEEIIVSTNDEILEVIESLKQMHEELERSKASLEIKVKARTKELEELSERQEETIKERTKEIQKRVEELEKFQKLAVGRELKMVELKEEIKKSKEGFKK